MSSKPSWPIRGHTRRVAQAQAGLAELRKWLAEHRPDLRYAVSLHAAPLTSGGVAYFWAGTLGAEMLLLTHRLLDSLADQLVWVSGVQQGCLIPIIFDRETYDADLPALGAELILSISPDRTSRHSVSTLCVIIDPVTSDGSVPMYLAMERRPKDWPR